MKKKMVALTTAVAAFSGSAFAADLPARTYTKAPVVEAPLSWTGLYLFGGAGGGLWNSDVNALTNPGGVPLTAIQQMGGHGWFGTVGAGYDLQFNGSWVVGIFADGQFGSLRGSINDNFVGLTGSEKLRDTWAVGARLGYLVAPNVFSYVNAGYTQSGWSGSQLGATTGGAAVATTPSFNRQGWFVGGGFENNLNLFGVSAPGWFMKTEYRAAYFDEATLPESLIGRSVPTGISDTFKPFVQTISGALVYRFNWAGPVIAK